MTPALERALADVLGRKLGYTPSPWPAVLHLLVEKMAAESGTDPVAAVRAAGRAGGPALDRLVDAATIGHTQFFRHSTQLEALAEYLRAMRPSTREIEMWSAGCASGEEAWSLAWVARKVGIAARVLGTDVSAESIRFARAGRYGARRTAGLEPRPTGAWEPDAAMRARVRFEVASLAEGDPACGGGPFDVVFCRNVLVYFDPAEAAATLARIATRVVPGGVVVVSPVEALMALPPGLAGREPLGWLERVPARATRPPPGFASPSNASLSRSPSRERATRGARAIATTTGPTLAADSVASLLDPAARALGRGDTDTAEDLLRAHLDRESDDATAWFLLGEALAQRGERAQAKAAFERAASYADRSAGQVDAETLRSAAMRRARERT